MLKIPYDVILIYLRKPSDLFFYMGTKYGGLEITIHVLYIEIINLKFFK